MIFTDVYDHVNMHFVINHVLMYLYFRRNRKLNCVITKRVIELHGMGYDQDFTMKAGQLICVQNSDILPHMK